MAPRSILKSIPFISHFPLPDTHSNPQCDRPTSSPIMKSPPSFSNSPLPFASSSHIPPLDSPHVHFPPTPTMTRMEMTHSPFSYDRKPIVVSPNVCAMPERGERDICEDERDEKDEGNNLDGGYFNPRLHVSRNTRLQGEARTARPLTPRSGTRSMSPARPLRTKNNRTRCYSLPSSLPQSLSPRIYPFSPRRHTDPYPTISRHQSALAVPSLVFDHFSEESDSEGVCESPPLQDAHPNHIKTMPVPGIQHVVEHFPGELSSGLGDTPFSNPGLDGGQLPTMTTAKMDDSKKSMTPPRPRLRRCIENDRISEAHLEGISDEEASSSPDVISGGMGLLTRTRTQTTKDSNACGFSKFCEPALEGCLGGF